MFSVLKFANTARSGGLLMASTATSCTGAAAARPRRKSGAPPSILAHCPLKLPAVTRPMGGPRFTSQTANDAATGYSAAEPSEAATGRSAAELSEAATGRNAAEPSEAATGRGAAELSKSGSNCASTLSMLVRILT
eukprot:CAMPEP_0172870248 /NCGR_PEP_ID=MMETSP1075-20121228/91334_1 /TAXON_ID=2916 /ORGANISM="Ceratium fusus, Strain PA161109" /LENGTH=135 /DNA_ID=CAMNT_0013720361 /DNA_START=71 /DNA_END=474 /DNA_ORIENTATION=+